MFLSLFLIDPNYMSMVDRNKIQTVKLQHLCHDLADDCL